MQVAAAHHAIIPLTMMSLGGCSGCGVQAYLCGTARGVHQAYCSRTHVGGMLSACEQLVVCPVHRVAALECHHVCIDRQL